ncbi:MAG: hypothetical protein LBQ59_04005 [Candidatus Peribacteria bacterium]|nr:hypothetical protein [Candidatus Peribacteria bacterium]
MSSISLTIQAKFCFIILKSFKLFTLSIPNSLYKSELEVSTSFLKISIYLLSFPQSVSQACIVSSSNFSIFDTKSNLSLRGFKLLSNSSFILLNSCSLSSLSHIVLNQTLDSSSRNIVAFFHLVVVLIQFSVFVTLQSLFAFKFSELLLQP